MKPEPLTPPPEDAAERRAVAPVLVYPPETLPGRSDQPYADARFGLTQVGETIVPPRDARVVAVEAGKFFRIVSTEGAQVGDLNLWNAGFVGEHFYSGKTRALHGTHLGRGDRLWSKFPYLRPMATVTWDTLDWYGIDADGGSVHDVIGTRCDPYTNRLLAGGDYHYCCHSNLTRALADATEMSLSQAEPLVHDVLNLFMCTGFDRATGQYFMKASPVRPGDYIEFFAEIDLLVGLSTCPGGDCGDRHSSDAAACHPLIIETWLPPPGALGDWSSPKQNDYDRSHGA